VFLFLFFVLLLPTTINETKVTLIILPLGLLVTFWCAADPRVRGRQVLLAASLFAAFLAIFVPAYNAANEGREYGVTIGEFFFDSSHAEKYMATGKGIGAQGQVGRIDALTVPMHELSKDPVSLFFGYGIGNASDSALGQQFKGHYYELFAPFVLTGFSRIVLEMGLIGLFLTLLMHYLIYRDCVVVARHGEGPIRAFAAGWAGVTVMMAVTIPYVDNLKMASMTYLFWYFSGLVAAKRMELSHTATHTKEARKPAPYLSAAYKSNA
jgi:O-antigen ligase